MNILCWLLALCLMLPTLSLAQNRRPVLTGIARFLKAHPNYDPIFYETGLDGHEAKIIFHYRESQKMDSLYVTEERDERHATATGTNPDTTSSLFRLCLLDLRDFKWVTGDYSSRLLTLTLFPNRRITRQITRPYNSSVLFTDFPKLEIRFRVSNDEEKTLTAYLIQLKEANLKAKNSTK